MSENTATVAMTRVTRDARDAADDTIAVEEPLEIVVAWRSGEESRDKNISVTMRTPGDDFDLAAGFLFTEGLVRRGEELESIRHWGSPNRVRVSLVEGARVDASKLERHFYTTSSCGICGKSSIDAVRIAYTPVVPDAPAAAAVIRALPDALRHAQNAFDATGGVHGAALFDREGTLLCAREDVGRHNAVDKVIGSFVRAHTLPPPGSMLMVSSRGGFELVQKAIVARIATIAFIGAPTTLAVDLAREMNVTLIAFLRDGRFNVYAGSVA